MYFKNFILAILVAFSMTFSASAFSASAEDAKLMNSTQLASIVFNSTDVVDKTPIPCPPDSVVECEMVILRPDGSYLPLPRGSTLQIAIQVAERFQMRNLLRMIRYEGALGSSLLEKPKVKILLYLIATSVLSGVALHEIQIPETPST